MPHKTLIVGNWKMNKSLSQAVSFITAVAEPVAQYKKIEPIVCPPYPWLAVIDGLLRDSSLQLGAQDVSAFKNGAYTGQVSAEMLAPHCQYVIIGHSERRRLCQETPDQINDKIKRALEVKLQPIVCISNLSEVEALAPILPLTKHWVIAYEPLAAIGSGQATDPAQVKDMVHHIHRLVGKNTTVLYGGSVTPDNIAQYTTICQGALVGGASLDPQSFLQLCAQTDKAQ